MFTKKLFYSDWGSGRHADCSPAGYRPRRTQYLRLALSFAKQKIVLSMSWQLNNAVLWFGYHRKCSQNIYRFRSTPCAGRQPGNISICSRGAWKLDALEFSIQLSVLIAGARGRNAIAALQHSARPPAALLLNLPIGLKTWEQYFNSTSPALHSAENDT